VSDLELTIDSIEEVTSTIRGFVLRPAPRVSLPSYVAGSHIVVDCGQVRNAYSLTGSGSLPDAYTICVLLRPDGRGGSRWMHHASPGDRLRCSFPKSAFAPVATARHHLIIAGGIGITPFLSHLRAARLWGRKATLIYGVGADGPVPYRRAIEELTGGNLCLTRDRAALLRAMENALQAQPIGTHLYVCGPGGLIDASLEMAHRLGWPDERCHVERFTGLELDDGAPFTVRLKRSNRSVEVPSGTSLLDALAAAGIEWPSMCRRGVCGECRMEGAEGSILHRDLVLTPAERTETTCLMPCVSRAEGVLILDL
jgi:ferredoxin-NADP reductase